MIEVVPVDNCSWKKIQMFLPLACIQGKQKSLFTLNGPNPRFAKISSQTLTSKQYNTLGLKAITHRQKYNLFLHNPALSCQRFQRNGRNPELNYLIRICFHLVSLLESTKQQRSPIATEKHKQNKPTFQSKNPSIICLRAKP